MIIGAIIRYSRLFDANDESEKYYLLLHMPPSPNSTYNIGQLPPRMVIMQMIFPPTPSIKDNTLRYPPLFFANINFLISGSGLYFADIAITFKDLSSKTLIRTTEQTTRILKMNLNLVTALHLNQKSSLIFSCRQLFFTRATQ